MAIVGGRSGALNQPGLVPIVMKAANSVGLARVSEFLSCIDANRFDETIPGLISLGVKEGLRDQGAQQIDDGCALESVACADAFYGGDAEAPDEDSKATQQDPFGLGEQLVAPI